MKMIPHRRWTFRKATFYAFVFTFAVALQLMISSKTLGDVPPFEWARSFGGTSNDRGFAIAVDSTNNIYVTGYFEGTATFGTTVLSTLVGNVFVAKLSHRGDTIWARSPSASSSFAQGRGIAVDSAGGVYVVGWFYGAITFGSTTLSPNSYRDAFIAKYNSAGAVVWARQAGAFQHAEAESVTVDSAGNVHVCGLFRGTASFDGVGLSSAGDADIFHVTYTAAGNVLWAKKCGGTDIDWGHGMAADSQGNTYLTGYFRSPVANFGGIALTNTGSTNTEDIFIMKYDSAGNTLWAAKAGGMASDYGESEMGRAIHVDDAQNVYIAGCFGGTAAFGSTNVTAFGINDGFLAKYNAAGSLQWVRRMGGLNNSSVESAFGLTVDVDGNSYVAGNFSGTASFGSTNLTSSGGSDGFLASFNASGNLLWAKKVGFIFEDSGQAVAQDTIGQVFFAGYYYDSANFDSTNVVGRGVDDIFVAKLPSTTPGALLVTTTNDSGVGSLRQAILNANAEPGSNTIQILVNGTIVLAAPLPTITGNTLIEGNRTNTAISGDGHVGIFTIASGTTNTFRGLTIVYGWLTNQNGGAISNGGTLLLEDCRLSGNQIAGGAGGAIFNSGNLTIRASSLIQNEARGATLSNPARGGGVFSSGMLRIEDSSLVDNRTYGPHGQLEGGQPGGIGRGGGVYIGAGTAIVSNSLFQWNEANGGQASHSANPSMLGPIGGFGEGGALFIENGQALVVGSAFVYNRADGGLGGSGAYLGGGCAGQGGKGGRGHGGGVAISGGNLTILNSTLSANVAGGGQGGNRQFAGDGGDGYGGSLFLGGGDVSLLHVSIVSSSALSGGSSGGPDCGSPYSVGEGGDGFGGGIYRASGSLLIKNSLIANNRAAGVMFSGNDLFGSFVSHGYNLFGSTDAASGFSPSDLQNIDPQIGPLLNNGGPTLTHALLPDSPALDAAAPDPAITVDQRGFPRPSGLAPDIGAFELSTLVPAFVDNFFARRVISGYTNYIRGTNTSYTKEPGELQHAGRKGAHSAWLSWVAPDAGSCVMDTFGSAFDTVLAVYTGESALKLTLVASNDDAAGTLQSQVSFLVTVGTAYQIAVDGYGTNDAGPFVFRMDLSGSRPAIVVQPQSQTMVVGSNVTFSVTASGDPPLAYQWLFDNNAVVGATNAVLSLIADATNAGPYRVIVSNSAGAITSSVATLTILLSPTIVSHPQSQTVIAGTNVTFTVVVEGTPPFSYLWRRDGTNIPGLMASSLTISNAQAADTGLYAALVTNLYGSVTSLTATLVVRYSLQLITNGNGAITASLNAPAHLPNSTVTLTAAPGPGYSFISWAGDATGANNPLTLTMTSNKVVIANFVFTASTLIVQVQGDGRVDKIPDREAYNLGEQVTLSAVPGRWHRFSQWSDGSAMNPRVIAIGPTNNYMAIFSPTTILETVTIGGISRTGPVGMPVILVDGRFVIELAATNAGPALISMQTTFPNSALLFTLDGSPAIIYSSLYTAPFTLGRSAVVRAIAFSSDFAQAVESDPLSLTIIPLYTLSAETKGGGQMIIAPALKEYLSNSVVNITATPTSGWTFMGWLGDAPGTNDTISLSMTRNLCVEAVFGTALFGTGTAGGAVGVLPQVELYPYGTTVRVYGHPSAGNSFVLWGKSASGTNNPLDYTVTNANAAIIAAFQPLPEGQHAFVAVPLGNGTISVSPTANRFNHGQTVTLRAVPDEGQYFRGWAGDASGSETPLSVSMTQSRIIFATFTRLPSLQIWQCPGTDLADALTLHVTAELGPTYLLEESSDLISWGQAAIVTNTLGVIQWSAPMASPRAFYRSLRAP